MKKLIMMAVMLLLIAAGTVTSYASAFEGTTDYYFESSGDSEFYNRGEQQYNYEGSNTEQVLELYDMTTAAVYTSEYGINIIMPSETVPVSTAPDNAPDTVVLPAADDVPISVQTESSGYPDTWANAYIPENVAYDVTPVEDLRNADGSIGRLQIPAIGLNVKVYDGDELAAMRKGVGHISGTSVWNSNVGVVGHNRGTNDYFGRLKTLSVDDTVTYTTNAGVRTYQVSYVGQIDETDWSMLQYTTDNRLTLITCVENVPGKRVLVQCVEIR